MHRDLHHISAASNYRPLSTGWWWFSRTGEHVGYESWVERDVLMALDADPGVEAVASQPMWLHWVSESGKVRRNAPDFFVRRADGTGVLIDVRPDHLVRAAHSAVFAATAVMAPRSLPSCALG